MAAINCRSEGSLLIISVIGDLKCKRMLEVIHGHYTAGSVKDVIWDFTHGSMRKIIRSDFIVIFDAIIEAVNNGYRSDGKTILLSHHADEYSYLCSFTAIAALIRLPIEFHVCKSMSDAEDWIR